MKPNTDMALLFQKDYDQKLNKTTYDVTQTK